MRREEWAAAKGDYAMARSIFQSIGDAVSAGRLLFLFLVRLLSLVRLSSIPPPPPPACLQLKLHRVSCGIACCPIVRVSQASRPSPLEIT